MHRVTNTGPSPRGIIDHVGATIIIAPGETREMKLTESSLVRYRAKIAAGDKLEIVTPLGTFTPPAAPKPPKAAAKKKAPKAKAKKAAAPEPTKLPAETPDPLAALRKEAIGLGISENDAKKWGERRLTREIAGRKQAG